ncbi:MAG: anaerobic ribonucleoside-triphosphate reductase activating protein [Candidatus Bathyarchaeia archaeon]|nr:anaerobic ribonucleoside-triphosphate reductase activating protein [Candidatus Bathyarchaeota archaeon]
MALKVRGRLGWIVELSGIDWFGNITFMLFLAGCNFRCPYCQNGSIVELDSGYEVSLEEILAKIERNIKLIDAVGVSGGEPTLQPRFVESLFEAVRSYGVKTFVNTNGSNPDLLDRLFRRRLLDYVAIDVKAPFKPDIYSTVIGGAIPGDTVIQNLRRSMDLCNAYNLRFEARTTIVPGLTDKPEYVEMIAYELRKYDCIYILQQFSPFGDILDPRYRYLEPTSEDTLISLARIALNIGLEDVRIRSRNGIVKVT